MGTDGFADLPAGARRIAKAWRGLIVEYAWLPPFQGTAPTRPNRLEVVFSGHSSVRLRHGDAFHDVTVVPGAMYVVGPEPTVLLDVREYSDTLEIYPDLSLLRSAAEEASIRDFALEPTLRGQARVTFLRDPAMLGIAHVLRRACVNRLTLSDIEASELTHLIGQRVLLMQYGVRPKSPWRGLHDRTLRAVADLVEDRLTDRLTLDDLAAQARMSPFHFARCFKRATGLAPHQYVLARRIELAKRLLLTTTRAVQDIAWSVGFENVSHFRRKFRDQIGIHPGALRRATRP